MSEGGGVEGGKEERFGRGKEVSGKGGRREVPADWAPKAG